MRKKVMFVIHAIALVTLMSSTYAKSTKLRKNRKTPAKKRLDGVLHPCDIAPKDTVIRTLNGAIMCERKTEEELERQLEKNGGYNRRYAAASLAEARKHFKNMLEVYGKDYKNTTGWRNWRSSNVSDVSLTQYAPTDNPVLYKVNVHEKDVKERMFESGDRIDPDGKRDGSRQRRSSDDSEIAKRDDPGMNIQCLPGGRKTEKGIHLCPACQRCTELSKAYFPRYINELTCDDSLSGYSSQVGCYLSNNYKIGNCHQIRMAIDLLVHKNGKFALVFQNETFKKYKEVYEPYTREISTCCECMVF